MYANSFKLPSKKGTASKMFLHHLDIGKKLKQKSREEALETVITILNAQKKGKYRLVYYCIVYSKIEILYRKKLKILYRKNKKIKQPYGTLLVLVKFFSCVSHNDSFWTVRLKGLFCWINKTVMSRQRIFFFYLIFQTALSETFLYL